MRVPARKLVTIAFATLALVFVTAACSSEKVGGEATPSAGAEQRSTSR